MNTTKVLNWIKKTGFPLEMDAATAFKKASFEVVQSFVYPDPQQNKGREIDVIAYDPDWLGIIQISFVLECKSSSKPWVVFTSEDTISNRSKLQTFGITSKDAKKVMANHVMNDGALKPIIHSQTIKGYGFHQALGNKNDKAYAAVTNLAKACADITVDRGESSWPKYAFAFPIIVIDSPLYECAQSEKGELKLVEVEESSFLFSAYLPQRTGCCVRVVRKECLADFSIAAKNMADEIRKGLKVEENKVTSQNGT